MDIFIEKNIPKFNCEKCAFTCSKKGDWDRHLLTRKHTIVTLCDNNEHNKNVNTNKDYICKNCKNSKVIVEPSIFKCMISGKTVTYDDWCERYELKNNSKDFIFDFFNENIFKAK